MLAIEYVVLRHSVEQPLGSLFDRCCHIALDAVCLHMARRKESRNEAARQRYTNVEKWI